MFPIKHAAVLHTDRDNSILSTMILGPIPKATIDQRERFQAALNTLRLQPKLHYLQKGEDSPGEPGILGKWNLN